MTEVEAEAWPALPYEEWRDTLDTVHMEFQILGKVRVALSPKEPEWAHVALYVTPRGISTGPVPSNRGLFEVEADFIDQQVVLRTDAGEHREVPLTARPVAAFWSDFVGALAGLGIDVILSPMPQEVPDPIPFPDDTVHHAYDPEYAARFWRTLTVMAPAFDEYRAAFRGKVSRVQFFWGSADLNVTRFSGLPCSPPPGADLLIKHSYDMEQISVGFWPGNPAFPEPAFYAYGYPPGDGIETAQLSLPPAGWNADLGEFVLRYDDVRTSSSPHDTLREFLDSAYAACARSRSWDPDLLG